jgi:hypothetical protein
MFAARSFRVRSEMADDPILRKLLDEAGERVGALVADAIAPMMTEAYERGREVGAEAQRRKMLRFLDADGMPQTAPENSKLPAAANAVSGPLCEVMCTMKIGPEGAGPQEIADYTNDWPGVRLNATQVHAALKSLERKGDLVRVARGKYRPSDTLLEEHRRAEMQMQRAERGNVQPFTRSGAVG